MFFRPPASSTASAVAPACPSTFPVGAEDASEAQQDDTGDAHADAGAQHRPVEPVGAAVVEHVDQKPHHAERDPDAQDQVEDPLSPYVSDGLLARIVHPFEHTHLTAGGTRPGRRGAIPWPASGREVRRRPPAPRTRPLRTSGGPRARRDGTRGWGPVRTPAGRSPG